MTSREASSESPSPKMADGGFKRLEMFNLWSTPEKFWIESSKVKTTQLLQIAREARGAVISMEPHLGQIPVTASKKVIYGVLGITDLPLGQVLIVITRRVNIGEIRSVNVWQMDCCEIIPVKWKSPGLSGPLQLDTQKRAFMLLTETLATPYFYFSYNGDVTNTLQRLSETSNPTLGKEAWERLDKKYVWNEFLLRPFLDVKAGANDLQAFLTPIVHGAIFIRRFNLHGSPFTWGVFTRRSKHRTGTRFFVRGADKLGNVANFNETEQIVEVKGKGVTSFVQTRGSMPFLWSQTPNIKYKPTPVIRGLKSDSEGAFEAHFIEQKKIYGAPQISINLIDAKKAEGNLEKFYSGLFKSTKISGLVYEYFDFHKECSKMRYERLDILIRRLAKYDLGFFYAGSSRDNPLERRVVRRQEGVFRTNCMDCLDRTNVVQSLLARENLVIVLKLLGVLPEGSTVEDLEKAESFQAVFRNTWADHANLVSVQYAGTGALKTDYTRSGKRTKYGLIQDGWNSAIRYYKNNFCDGFRTDALHFFLGEISIKDIEVGIVTAKYRKEGVGSFTANLPMAMLMAVVIAVLAMIFSPEMSYNTVGIILVCYVMIGVCGKLIVQNNELFVDFPLPLPGEIERLEK